MSTSGYPHPKSQPHPELQFFLKKCCTLTRICSFPEADGVCWLHSGHKNTFILRGVPLVPGRVTFRGTICAQHHLTQRLTMQISPTSLAAVSQYSPGRLFPLMPQVKGTRVSPETYHLSSLAPNTAPHTHTHTSPGKGPGMPLPSVRPRKSNLLCLDSNVL